MPLFHYCADCYKNLAFNNSLGKSKDVICKSCNKISMCEMVIMAEVQIAKSSDFEILKSAFTKVGILFREFNVEGKIEGVTFDRSIVIDPGFQSDEKEVEFVFKNGRFLAHTTTSLEQR